jgi:hypothetical protein
MVAAALMNLGGPAFGIVVFPDVVCCQPKIDCMYDCGYWGDCHATVEGFKINNESYSRFSSSNKQIEDKLTLYPTPILEGNFLNVRLGDDIQLVGPISISDINGQNIKEFDNGLIDTKSIKLDLTEIHHGIYLLYFNTNNGVIAKKILIK